MSACGVPEGEGEGHWLAAQPSGRTALLTEPCIVNLLRIVLVYLFPGVVAERRPAGVRIARAPQAPGQLRPQMRSVFPTLPRERKLQLFDESVGT